MTREQNIKAILESNFAGFKDEIINTATKKLLSLDDDTSGDLISRKAAHFKVDLNYEKFQKIPAHAMNDILNTVPTVEAIPISYLEKIANDEEIAPTYSYYARVFIDNWRIEQREK